MPEKNAHDWCGDASREAISLNSYKNNEVQIGEANQIRTRFKAVTATEAAKRRARTHGNK